MSIKYPCYSSKLRFYEQPIDKYQVKLRVLKGAP